MQAYKKGLEMKLALLTEENSRLKSHVAEVSHYFYLVFSFFVCYSFGILGKGKVLQTLPKRRKENVNRGSTDFNLSFFDCGTIPMLM